MSTTVPAITAKMGSRTYYIAKMRASELAMQVSVASELAEWRELSLNELYQRKLNEKRVQQEIAPYLAKTEDRFFGSIIVWVTGDDVVEFEPVAEQINVRAPYREAAESIGFLILGPSSSGESGLVALDGQHRLAM
jgi:DNA sulfur modification protein DndB